MKLLPLDHNALKEILPQAYPFLMLDRVVEYTEGQSLTAIKNITANEWFFQETQDDPNNTNHFPETLLIEAAAQAALVLYHVSKVRKGEKSPTYILGRAQAEFKDVVAIGDQLKIQSFATKMMDKFGFMDVKLYTDFKNNIGEVRVIYSVIRESI